MVKCPRKLHPQTPSSLAWLWLDTLRVLPCQTAAGCRAPAASFVLLLRSPDPARELKVKMHCFAEVLGWFGSLKHSTGEHASSEHASMIRGSVRSVERLNRSCNFGSARMVLGEIVLLPAQAGWAPFASSPRAPPTQGVYEHA